MTDPPATAQEAGENLPGPACRFDMWKVIGPGGGGGMFMPTISPHDPNIVLEHCDMTGAYVTTDGGLSWRMFNLRSVVQTFAFDPTGRTVIYAGNAALWRSEDTGRTWKMVFPDPEQNTVEHMSGDHADWWLSTDDPSYPGRGRRIQAIAVDPSDSDHLWVVFGGHSLLVLRSLDRGNTWEQTAELAGRQVHDVYVRPGSSPGDPPDGGLYIVSETGIHRGSAHGWTQLDGPPGGEIRRASIGATDPLAEPVIYATTRCHWKDGALVGGVWVSEDGGRSWQSCGEALTQLTKEPGSGEPPNFRAIACSPDRPETVYAGVRGLHLGEDADGPIYGILKSTDRGRTWQVVWRETDGLPSPNMDVSWLESRMPDSRPHVFFIEPLSMSVAPGHPDICYVTDIFRTYRTLDGGKSWQQVTSVHLGGDRWTTRGLDVTTCYGVHFDPFDLNHMFISYTDIGLSQSADGGRSWTSTVDGIPQRWKNTLYWAEFDPELKGLVWGAWAYHHDLPRPKMWRRTDPASYEGGVAVSADGGRHWQVSNQGMPETAVTHLLLEPTSPVGARVLYACGFGRGVYKSVDNGKSWMLKNEGIEGKQPFAWRVVRAGDGALYLIVARRSDDGRIGDAEDGALYTSTDGAEHWGRMSLPEGTNGPMGLAIDPTDNQRMYLAAWGVYSPEGDTGGGLFLSTDGGKTWESILAESQHVYDITIDPQDPNVLYLCGFDSAAYRSTDGGRTWTRIKGFTFKWGHRVMPDPADPEKIYITTFGGSVWHGPAAGDPEAVEDILPPLPATRNW